METTTSFSNEPHNFSNSSATITSYSGTALWIVVNFSITIATILGNVLTIAAILISRKLSSLIANHFIFSLAVSDLMVGLSIPYHMSFYLTDTGEIRITCLLRFVLITFACASSIFNLLLIATDRYVAIVYPLHYNRYLTRKISVALITVGWLVSFFTATVPLYWNRWHEGITCEINEVTAVEYMNYIVTPLFAMIWIIMFFLYIKICKEASGHANRMKNSTNLQNIRQLGDSKSFQIMMTILGCFSVCWLPYFVVTIYLRTADGMSKSLMYEISFELAVANSGMNPLIYAWKNSNFRRAFYLLVKCQSPNATPSTNYITNHIPSKKHSMNGICNGCVEDMTHSEIEMRSKKEKTYKEKEHECSVTTEMTNINASPTFY